MKLCIFFPFYTGHPHFFNQLSCGLDLVSMAGEWLTATANTNMFTYEIAPVFILMETVVMERMRQIIGWQHGGDSILAPGGSVSNLYAFLAARHRMFPLYKEKGLVSIQGQLVMFTSDQVSIASPCLSLSRSLKCLCAVPLLRQELRRRLRPRNRQLRRSSLRRQVSHFFTDYIFSN
jgi:Pyridoxal-dependent decarboxylase conserved domain